MVRCFGVARGTLEKQFLRVAFRHVASWLAAGSEGAYKLTFAMLLIVAALGFTYTGSDGNFPSFELQGVLLRVLAFSGVALIVALALPRVRGFSNAALALATLAGVFTVYVVHTDLYHPPNRVWMVLLLAAALVALFSAFRAIEEFRWGGFALTVAASLAIGAAAWPEIGPELKSGMSTPGGLLDAGSPVMWTVLALTCTGTVLAVYVFSRFVQPRQWGGLALLGAGSFLAVLTLVLGSRYGEGGSGYYSQGWEDHPNVRSVAFTQTPNIYFVGFDSIVPDAITRKYMGIETTDFHRLMEREMRRFRNLFANAVPTYYSFNTLMALDQDIYLERGEEARRLPNYFPGHDHAPLVWLLRQNGYETTSICLDTYFGRAQGPYIDNYIFNSWKALCPLLDEGVRELAFWGYCWSREERLPSPERLPDGAFQVQQLTAVDKARPQFVIAHIYMPSHTSGMFDYENRRERERFLAGYKMRFDRAAIYLGQIIEHLKANDPDAILFVFGDHGAWLSQGMDVEDDPQFVLQDRFGILGGVHPPDRCALELDAAEAKGYMTSLDVVHALVECLSAGQSPLGKPRRDRFWIPPHFDDAVSEDHAYEYKDYLYE